MTVSFALGGGFDPRRLSEFQDAARKADAGGFAMVLTGDSPALMGDCYVGLSVLAQNTIRSRVGSWVTNAVTRHPVVVASAISTIDTISGGRAVLGLGSGNSGVYNLGRKPAPMSELEAFIGVLRDLWRTGEATWQGQTLHFEWSRKPVPIFMSPGGPKGLHMAGRIADGVFIEAGLTPEVITDTLARLSAGAAEAGRSLDDIEVWWSARGSFGASIDDAVIEDHAGLAGLAARLGRGDADSKAIPEEIKPRLERLQADYNVLDHGRYDRASGAEPPIKALGLTDYLVDRFAIAGTPDDWVRRIKALEALGVRNIALGSSAPDRGLFVDTIVREVFPALGRDPS